MLTFAFFNLPARGHLNPTLPVVKELVAGGATVHYFIDEKYRKLVDPYDPQANLTARARSYLHSNCAQCHVEAGGGNAQIDLEFTTPLKDMRLVGVKPQHHTFGLKDARLIAPGHPERSVLLHRMAHRREGHMPPLATSLVDEPAVAMLREWIRQLKQK